MLDEGPRPPADAYYEVAPLMPEVYWLERPPFHGTRLIVTSRNDGKPTTWYMGAALAAHIQSALTGRPVTVAAAPYDDRRRGAI